MPDILIRDVPKEVLQPIKDYAARERRSMQSVMETIMADWVKTQTYQISARKESWTRTALKNRFGYLQNTSSKKSSDLKTESFSETIIKMREEIDGLEA